MGFVLEAVLAEFGLVALRAAFEDELEPGQGHPPSARPALWPGAVKAKEEESVGYVEFTLSSGLDIQETRNGMTARVVGLGEGSGSGSDIGMRDIRASSSAGLSG